MTNIEISKANFAKHLADSLLMKYKKQVSVVFFVDQFNLHAYGTNVIAYETGRKWLKGISIPQVSKMNVLIKWLNIDVKKIFEYPSVSKGDSYSNAGYIDASAGINKSDHLVESLQSVIIDLDANAHFFLLVSALTLKEISFNQHINMDYKLLVKYFSLKDTYSSKANDAV